MTITHRGRRRFAILPLVAVLAAGATACDAGAGGVTEDEFGELESRVGTLEEDFATFQEEAGVGE